MTESDGWSTEAVERIVSESIDAVLRDQTYSDEQALHWNGVICENIMSRLIELKKATRYAVDCLIMQRNGAGLHSASACYFDSVNDGQLSYLWPKDKSKDQPNKTMLCLVTVFGTVM